MPDKIDEVVRRVKRNSYAHMCRMDHEQIGHNDSEHEECPLCRMRNERDEARAEVEALKAACEDYSAQIASQQAIHDTEMEEDGRARAVMVELCHDLDAPIYEDAAQGIREVLMTSREMAMKEAQKYNAARIERDDARVEVERLKARIAELEGE